jgi:calcium-dependent protein kinase
LRREYTASCDIWSIGVITYILLCGYPPFYGDSDSEIFDSVRTGYFDFPSPEWDDISDTAKQFVTYLLHKEAKKRPTAAEAMHHEWITKNARCPHQPKRDSDSNHQPQGSLMANASVRGTTFQKYLAMQKLKKVALVTIAKNLTQQEVGSLEDIFRQVDRTGDGVMSLTELNDAITRGKLPPEIQEEINALKNDLSLSDNDTLNWKAFLTAAVDQNLVMREDKIRFAFDHFHHQENTEYLTVEDFADIFKGEAQGKEIFDFLDTDRDGKVKFDDFRAAIEECIDINNC